MKAVKTLSKANPDCSWTLQSELHRRRLRSKDQQGLHDRASAEPVGEAGWDGQGPLYEVPASGVLALQPECLFKLVPDRPQGGNYK